MEQTKTRISKKQLQSFIDRIAVVEKSKRGDSDVYVSKIDGSYITHVGMEDKFKFLLKRRITEEIQDGYGEPRTICIGYNPTEKKWYGWSHRAIYGFGIGSKCKKGDCGYKPSNKEDFRDSCLSFWGDSEYSIGDDKVEFGKGEDYDGKIVDGVIVTYTYNDKVPNKSIRGTTYANFSPFPKKWGKGEWTAKTMEEAKEMAIDFAESVS